MTLKFLCYGMIFAQWIKLNVIYDMHHKCYTYEIEHILVKGAVCFSGIAYFIGTPTT